jgi:hypothetical protein
MIPETRYKAVVIPTIKGKFVVVRYHDTNKKRTDLTFIGGGCGPRENKRNCAIRELKEETRGALNVRKENLKSRIRPFTSTLRSERELAKNVREGKKVSMEYHVFFAPLKNTTRIKNIKHRYWTKTNLTKAEKETRGILLRSPTNLERGTELWNFWKHANVNIFTKLRGERFLANKVFNERPSTRYVPPSARPSNTTSRPQTARWNRSRPQTPSGSWRK